VSDPAAAPPRAGWIFSPLVDLCAFAGPVVAAWALVGWFASQGRLHDPMPAWLFALVVIGCDVGHVWSTVFRAYLDPLERARRPLLLTLVPIICVVVGTALHWRLGSDGFWRVMAYLALFHFVRQQWGWMAYAGRKSGVDRPWDRRLDRLAIHAATIAPVIWWHTRLPRAFDWFKEGDFVAGLPAAAGDAALLLHWGVLAAWIGRQALHLAHGRPVSGAKCLVLATTWCTWYGGIVWLNSDVAFTTTNVLAHGVPYVVLIWWWGRGRWKDEPDRPVAAFFKPAGVVLFLGVLGAIAWTEEAFWDRLVWHDHPQLFPGPAVTTQGFALALASAVLITPQLTHYILDGFLWKTRSNPEMSKQLGLAAAPGGDQTGAAPTSA
jgi:hypothetical protein